MYKHMVRLGENLMVSRYALMEARLFPQDSGHKNEITAEEELRRSISVIPSDYYEPKIKVIGLRSKRRKIPIVENKREATIEFIAKNRDYKEARDRIQRRVRKTKPLDSKKDGWPTYFRDRADIMTQSDAYYFGDDATQKISGYGSLKEKSKIYGSPLAYARDLGVTYEVLRNLPLEKAVRIQERLEGENFNITDLLKLGQPIFGERSGKLYIVSRKINISSGRLTPDEFFEYDGKRDLLHLPFKDVFTYVMPKPRGQHLNDILKRTPERNVWYAGYRDGPFSGHNSEHVQSRD